MSAVRKPDFGELLRWVAFETGIAPHVIVGPYRGRGAVRARTAVAWGARTFLGLSLQGVGNRLGERDHSTIASAHRRAIVWITADPAFRDLSARMAAFMGLGAAK